MDCLSPRQLEGLVRGTLDPAEHERARTHVDGCATCSVKLERLSVHTASGPVSTVAEVNRDGIWTPSASSGADSDDEPSRAQPLLRGAQVGRYVIVSLLGKGGMGEVYVAYDPELDRKVAVKVLQVGSGTASSRQDKQVRLLREAQAMARLSHPNVVAVHDVGTFGARVFMAMELVDGTTLRRWLKDAPRSRRQVLEVLVAAGRGLAEAHAAGLVHRDFKPDNVLVAKSGAVKVTDFGLARAQALGEKAPPFDVRDEEGSEPSSRGSGALSAELTRAGALVGTPSYMAPEQYRGAPPDPRTDQFSFAVTLYEALHGKRPYEAAALRGLGVAGAVSDNAGADQPTQVQRPARAATTAVGPKKGPPATPAPPNHAKLPGWLQRHLVRALAPDPTERFDSMGALLAAVSRDPTIRLRRVALGTAAGVTLALSTYVAAPLISRDTCSGGADRFASAWSPARKEAIRGAFLATGAPQAAEAWDGVSRVVDAYANQWVAMYGQTCEANRREEQSDAILAVRMSCLERRLKGVDALADLLSRPDPAIVEKAVEAVSSLRTVDGCANLEALLSPVPPPDDAATRAEVERIRGDAARAQALWAAGSYRKGLPLAEQVVEAARATRYRPLEAEAYNLLGWFHDRLGDAKGSETARYEAVHAAAAGHHDEVAVQAATELVFTLGNRQQRYDAAHLWARQAQAILERLGGNDELAGKLANNLGALAYVEGRFADAEREYRRALALREKVLGPDHLETAKTLANLGLLLSEQHQFEQAIALYDRALKIQTQTLGPSHPQVATSLVNLALSHQAHGAAATALSLLQRAFAIRESTLGLNHVVTWQLLNDLGKLYESMGELDQARAHHERALRIAEEAIPPGDPTLAAALMPLAEFEERQGRFDDALRRLERSHQLAAAALGPRDNEATNLDEQVARVLLRQNRPAAALARLQKALAFQEETMGASHPFLSSCLRLTAEAYLALNRPRQALASIERAARIVEPLSWTDADLAPLRFAYARTLGALGKDPDRATKLAEQARAGFTARGPLSKRELAEVDAWLARHRVVRN